MSPKMSVPKDSLKPPERIPPGVYEVRLDGFKPKLTRAKQDKTQSINYQPQLKIINCASVDADGKPLNGRQIFDWLNQNAGWVVEAFSHAFGFKLVETDGDVGFVGQWNANPSDPDNVEKFVYNGPLLGAMGRVEVVEVQTDNNRKFTNIKQYFCKIPGCQEKHPTDLTSR